MRTVIENGETTLLEVYSGVKLESSEGNCIGVCMRDDTFEISMFKNNDKTYPISWHRVNFETKTIEPMISNTELRGCDNA